LGNWILFICCTVEFFLVRPVAMIKLHAYVHVYIYMYTCTYICALLFTPCILALIRLLYIHQKYWFYWVYSPKILILLSLFTKNIDFVDFIHQKYLFYWVGVFLNVLVRPVVRIKLHADKHMYIYMYIYAYMRVQIHTYVHMYIHICIFMHMYVYIYIYLYMYVCLCIRIYACTY